MMRLFKTLVLVFSFIFTVNISYAEVSIEESLLSSKTQIDQLINQMTTTTENFSALFKSLNEEIEDALSDLQYDDSPEKIKLSKDFNDYLVDKVFQNKSFLKSFFRNFKMNELDRVENRFLIKFLNSVDKTSFENEELISFFNKQIPFPHFIRLGKNIVYNSEESSQFSILNFNIDDYIEKPESFFSEISNKNPELICFEGVFSSTDAEFLFNKLQENYSFFFFDIGTTQTSQLNTGLFIASKYMIGQMKNQNIDGVSCLDFSLIYRGNKIRHIYVCDFQFNEEKISSMEKIVNKLNNDSPESEVPSYFCANFGKPLKDIFMNQNYRSSNASSLICKLQDVLDNPAEKALNDKNETIQINGHIGVYYSVEKTCCAKQCNNYMNDPCLEKSSFKGRIDDDFFDEPHNYKCRKKNNNNSSNNKDDGFHGHADLMAKEKIDKNGKLSSEANGIVEQHYTHTTESGVSFSAQVSAEAKINSSGKAEAAVGGGVSANWKK
jgi:hypothetical protein